MCASMIFKIRSRFRFDTDFASRDRIRCTYRRAAYDDWTLAKQKTLCSAPSRSRETRDAGNPSIQARALQCGPLRY